MSPQTLATRLEKLTILRNNSEEQKIQVYKFLCKEGTTPSQSKVYTETYADLERKIYSFEKEMNNIKTQLAV